MRRKFVRQLKTLGKFLEKVFVFLLIVGWLFAGWPQISENIPQKINKAEAAANQIILMWGASSTPAGWTCISCVASDPFYGVFPRASSTYGSASSSDDTVSHTLTFSTSTAASLATSTAENAGSVVPNGTHVHAWSNSSTASTDIRPPFLNIRFIQAATTTIPNGAIGMFDVASTSSLPSLWTYYSLLDGRYPRGGTASSTGGASTHTHTVSITSGTSTLTVDDSANTKSVAQNTHTHAISSSLSTSSSNDPPYITLVFAQLTATTTLSTTSTPGLIAMFDSTTLPSGWTSISGVGSSYEGKFIKGSSTIGSTGGSSTHSHGGTATLTSDGASQNRNVKTGTGGQDAADVNHTHNVTYTIASATSLPIYRDVILGQYQVTTQAAYRWYNNTDSADLIGVSSNPSSGSDQANSIAIDATNSVMYVAGFDGTPGNSEWRIEKRDLSTSTLIYATTTNPSSNTDIANAIAIDTASGTMYVAGYDQTASSTNDEWRIEARSLATGALVTGFGTNGVVTSNASGSVDRANAIALNKASSTMYVVGYDSLTSADTRWRIEARNFSDGSLVYATTTNPTTGADAINTIALDTASGTMYLAGYDSSSGRQIRIEKRNLSDGSLVYATTTNPTAFADSMNSIVLDTSASARVMYLGGYQNAVFGLSNIRLEKRTMSDGSIVFATSSDPGGGGSVINGLQLDTANSALYAVGYDFSSSDFKWRYEKRSTSDGTLTLATTSNPATSGLDAALAVAFDISNGYLYAAGYDASGGNAWRIEKRAISDFSTSWGAPLAAQDTSIIAPVQGTPFRLRMLLHSTGTVATSGLSIKLQFAEQSSTCDTSFSGESYSDVATSSGVIRYFDNQTPANADTLFTSPSDPAHGSDAVKKQTYVESNNATNTVSAITTGQDGEWDFSLVDNSASSGVVYCFRAVKSDGTVLNVYNVIPQITTAGSFNQSAYRFFDNTDSIDLNGTVANPSSGGDAAYAIAVDATNSAMYAVGYDSSPGNKEWRIEARSTTSTLIYATSSNPSSNDDAINAIAIDTASGTMYVAGYDQIQGSTNDEWRIEARNLSNGSTTYTITSNASGSVDRANAIAINKASGTMYAAGYDSLTAADTRWRIEARNLSDGSLVYATTTNPSTGDDKIQAIALDTASGTMYLAGYDSVDSLDQRFRIEKRNLSDGSLVYATTTNPSAWEDKLSSLALDLGNRVMYTGGYYSQTVFGNTADAYFEKRNFSDGSVVYATSSGVSGLNDVSQGIVIDSQGGFLYSASYFNAAGEDQRWRIEKRTLSTGSLAAATSSDPSTNDDIPNALTIDTTNSALYLIGYDQVNGSSNSEWRIEKRSPSDFSALWGTPLAATNATTTLTSVGKPFRLRMLIHSNQDLAANSQSFKLQFAEQSGTCDTRFVGESYSDVATSSGVIRYFNNQTPTDGDTLFSNSNDPTHGGDTKVGETYEEANNFTNSSTISASQDGEWDFPLVDSSAPTGTSYCFRSVKSTGVALVNYGVIPEIRTLPLPGTPGTPTYTGVSTSTLTVNWTSATYADYYRLERATSSFAEIATTTAVSYNDSGLALSTTYQYRVRATNQAGTGSYSASSSVTTLSGYASSGTLVSVIIDTTVTNGVAPNSLYWEGSSTAGTSVKFQFAGATSTAGPWNYVGWNNNATSSSPCDANSYYDPGAPSVSIEIKASCHQNLRYIRYKVYLSTTDLSVTPQVDRVILNYAQ